MKTITIKSLEGKSFIINPALITHIEQSEPALGIDTTTGERFKAENNIEVKINYTGGNPLTLSTQEWKIGYDTSELESNDIDIAEYKKFLSELEAA